MKLSDLASILDSIQLPYAYRAFPEGKAPNLPFICYLFDSARPEAGDNINQATITTLSIELYTEQKDFAIEQTVEDVLTANEIVFSKDETWIEKERMQMVVYTTEVLINGSE